ncbi:RecQ family ATP-dependent DNA helicase [Yaniella flava]|uniref:DNA 3'-5' helicase n=1 Tax=Yaniella flava TaxID=287930 RepID=A0ABP5FU38_9MICC
MALRDEATQVLSELVGKSAQFHEGQFEAIEAIVDQRRRGLVVQRTGWGKSAVYFVSTALLRRRGAGPTLIISPLLALMADQIAAAQRAGIVAESINSTNATSWGVIAEQLARDEIDVLLISPERLNNPMFRETQLPDLIDRLGMMVIDEAHCISDWGHDFRPDYRRIGTVINELPNTPILATTATANQRVVDDVLEQLGDNVFLTRGPLARSSLRLSVLPTADSPTRIGWLIDHLEQFESSGIIYTLTVAAAQDIAQALQTAGHNVAAYTGATAPEERTELEQALKDNRVKALVATSALGMGFDKPDLGFVVHFGAPSSPVSYYQHIGRAGRGTQDAQAVLLPGVEDQRIWEFFATASMPDESTAHAVLQAASSPISVPALSARVDLSPSRLELLLKILAVDDAMVRVKGGWQTTGTPWQYDAARYEHVAAQRVAEQNLMLDYQQTPVCRMRFLSETLDDPYAQDCGRCDNCVGPWLTLAISNDARGHAQRVLSRPGVEIAPRRMWPTGLDNLGIKLKGKITLQHEPGRALARLTDLGWGPTLRQLMDSETPDVPVSQHIVKAIVEVLADWDWAQRPIAVVSMPSPNRPQLVGSLAHEIAKVGQMPYLGELQWLGEVGTPAANSAFRLAQVYERYAVSDHVRQALASAPQEGPVLLVDDFASTRWSLTVATMTLREAGAHGVLPLTLGTA